MSWRFRRLRTWLSSTCRTRTVPRSQSRAVRGGRLNGAPPSLTRMVWYRFQAVSRPRLSYTPPSLSPTFLRYRRELKGSSPVPGANQLGSHLKTNGESTGGNAEEAATAAATGTVG